ncbi:hypothetical protein NAEGRDRAFT_74410 [Naegleria gruberi]|uniref:Uncharacterized protein n=1 Tax=Naegleria gruberi TaxID=5762 RepID=D2VZ93_NAEGR|nr:uncharacterized protein NAEGRDRAFT_74410 [Naegleria gruberi]EFC37903.1 hypothetical protein NAEGRDRAFT_74410 [Naegleria gruberi]|eukprot:XP_002670647.1 hypothetical protein NAEGRDRAFT_74410 [Naegleria gruberi strain NEG-M]
MEHFHIAVSAAAYFDGDRKQSIDILDECIKTDPKNIYIHYLKASCLNNLTSSESDLNIVRNNYSDAIHHLEKALAYLENIPKLPLPTLAKTNFSHEIEEPEKQVERINDLKFTPICLLLANVYARAAESGVSIDLRHIYGAKGVDYVRQVELYSRSPNEPYLYMSKGGCYYACGMYELAVNAYSSVERFEAVLDPNAIIDSLCYASNGMVALGYSDKCLEAMEFYIEKYNNDARLVFQKILCKEYMCRSKDELRQVLKEFEQLKESIQDLKLTPWIYSRVNEQTDARINDIFAAINNPQIAERW